MMNMKIKLTCEYEEAVQYKSTFYWRYIYGWLENRTLH